jgi:hypothetical protein
VYIRVNLWFAFLVLNQTSFTLGAPHGAAEKPTKRREAAPPRDRLKLQSGGIDIFTIGEVAIHG